MRVLLDESLPRRLKEELPGHDVRTVAEIRWAGKKNGDLLRLAEPHFDVLVTTDRHLPHQQSIADLQLAVVVLLAKSNDYADVQPVLAKLVPLIDTLVPGQVLRLTA